MDDKQRMKLTIHEVIGIGTVVVAITTSFLFLRADVLVLAKDVSILQGAVSTLTIEQAKMKTIVDLVYEEGVRKRNRDAQYDRDNPIKENSNRPTH